MAPDNFAAAAAAPDSTRTRTMPRAPRESPHATATVLTVVGARPQFVKAAAVSRVLRATGPLREVLVHTGQHFDANMSDVFFDELAVPDPDVHLGIHGGGHGAMTGRMLEALEEVMLAEQPDAALLYGDTNSTLAAALAAAKLHIPIVHVESGLRSYNRVIPEEVNRVLTDHASDLLLAPSHAAVSNLLKEGIGVERIRFTGDVTYDVALHFAAAAQKRSAVLARLGLGPGGYLLATVHRAENTGAPARLAAIFEALEALAEEVAVVLPLHPRTRAALEAAGMLARAQRSLRLTEPLGYLDMVMLEKHARVVATDSGGVQKEAFFFGVPCVTLREETEWVELVELGWNVLAPPTDAASVAAALRAAGGRSGRAGEPYGDGRAGERVTAAVLELLGMEAWDGAGSAAA